MADTGCASMKMVKRLRRQEDFEGELGIDTSPFPKTIEKLVNGCFANSGITMFDSRVFPELKVIPSDLFRNATMLEKALFVGGITTISDKVFSGCTNLKVIGLGRQVENFDVDSLLTFCSRQVKEYDEYGLPIQIDDDSYIVTIYAVKGSQAAKKLRHRAFLIEVRSEDEVINSVLRSEHGISKTKQSKYKFMLPNTEYGYLLKDTMMPNIDKIYSMMIYLNNNDLGEVDAPSLDTEKFKYTESGVAKTVESWFNGKKDIAVASDGTSEAGFIGLSNFITSVLDNGIGLYTEENIGDMDESIIMLWEVEKSGSCIGFVQSSLGKRHGALVIIYKGKPVFMAVTGRWKFIANLVLLTTNDVSVGRFFKEGDKLNIELGTGIVGGCGVCGDTVVGKIKINFFNTSVMLGSTKADKHAESRGHEPDVCSALYYDVVDQKLFEVAEKRTTKGNPGMLITRVYTLDWAHRLLGKYDVIESDKL